MQRLIDRRMLELLGRVIIENLHELDADDQRAVCFHVGLFFQIAHRINSIEVVRDPDAS